MNSFQPRNIWTSFVTALFALLAALGFMSAPATAAQQRAAEPATTTHEHMAETTTTAAATAPGVRWTLPRDRALPPTMKQRIRAEAHGSSPATRHLSSYDGTDTAETRSAARTSHGAPAGDASLLPP
ncbi:DUF6344 domain-containing protein [Streptomyces sp. NPDC056347]|uniref:DUF6344 domain-containing protein n=1 Tax=Streptomyces sp. NPDC056347 TaxID=3345790 RepID=UPI0035DBFE64